MPVPTNYDVKVEKDAIYMKEDFTDEDGMRSAELEGEFAELGGWEAESDAAQLLQNLGIPDALHMQNMSELTNGEKNTLMQRLWDVALRKVDETML